MAAYCSYAGGQCDHGDQALACAAKATVFCRNLRQKYEREKEQQKLAKESGS